MLAESMNRDNKCCNYETTGCKFNIEDVADWMDNTLEEIKMSEYNDHLKEWKK